MVLLRFLDAEYSRLDSEQRGAFESLLDEQDPDLAGWLWGGRVPPPQWQALIERIRQAAGITSDPVPNHGL